jgi:hypothetical protein
MNDKLTSPICLTNGSLFSPNRVFEARQGADGHFVVYKQGNPIFATGRFNGGNVGGRLCMQSDGNLVNYTVSGSPYWDSNTKDRGRGPYTATMQDDGNFVIYDSTNTATWSTNTSGR